MDETAKLVKELLIKPEFTVLTEHQERMEFLLKREFVKRKIQDRYKTQISEFYELGFRFIVTPEFALKFKYAASIRGGCVGEYDSRSMIEKAFRYTGDIPEFVLDNIEKLTDKERLYLRSGLYNCDISVHSMDYLPIEIENIPRMVDPVAIAWWGFPKFQKSCFGWKYIGEETIGAIIGVWDGEKEIEIL